MIVKISLALLHLGLVKHAQATEFAVGKSVDDGATEVVTCKIVDSGSPMVAAKTTSITWRFPPAGWYAAGATTSSEGTGITVLSSNIKKSTVP